ncbi:MAG: PD-(D/E)XK nuclease family protein, partial [Chitinispirillaceae bacterium]|nr:PD-(D/E)XK nuclease family protein [Chitinispirillaceae bacterium]
VIENTQNLAAIAQQNSAASQEMSSSVDEYGDKISDFMAEINKLKELTSIPLEIGNVVHGVLEAFLRRLQKSDKEIDEKRFFSYAHELVNKFFSEKTFIELYYGYEEKLDFDKIVEKVDICLKNLINSPSYNWIFMAAIKNRENWMIEPDGFGETRLADLKVYCKMDFLLPVDEYIYIFDWKTGNKDETKHTAQLIGYAAAASSLFSIPFERIFPRIIYLYPTYDELEIKITSEDLGKFIRLIKKQTEEMYGFCQDIENNIPLPIENFSKNPSPSICKQCKFRELCFPDFRNQCKM